MSILHSLFADKDCHPYLPTFLNILETDNSDQIEKKFVALLLFYPPPTIQVNHLWKSSQMLSGDFSKEAC